MANRKSSRNTPLPPTAAAGAPVSFDVAAEMAIENVGTEPLTYMITMSPGCRMEVMEGSVVVTLPGEAH